MLNPDNHRLYTDALRPPPGYQFVEAVAATYSLDLETLLTIPLHLALFSSDRPTEELLRDGVALLEALRRTTEHVTVFAQASRLIAPANPHVLYGLLEPVVVEVLPPAPNGSFHPKLWLIRFENPNTGDVQLRLLVLTRNITDDRCWDLVLTLDGEPGNKRRKENRELAKLVSRLPDLAVRGFSPERMASVQTLAELAHTAEWELPGDFEEVIFHTLGLGRSAKWRPRDSDQLIVISPFLSDAALKALLGTTDNPLALVSRPEALAMIDPGLLERFERVLVLADQAEVEDGEESEPRPYPEQPFHGLHAKAYVVKRGWETHLYVGSANATNPALINDANVELVAQLIGRRRKVGEVNDVLDASNFGRILTDYLPDPDQHSADPAVVSAREALEHARRRMVSGGLRIRFAEHDDRWAATLVPAQPLSLEGVAEIRAWLVTRHSDTAVPADLLRSGNIVEIPDAPLSLLTSFVAFELISEVRTETLRFVLSLGADGLPVVERDAAIVRDVIRNRDGFLRYVLLLLAEIGDEADVVGSGAGAWGRFSGSRASHEDLPLFENLTRAFCRRPEQLTSIRRLMNEIGLNPESEVVPAEFRDLWSIFEAYLLDSPSVRV